MALAVVGPIVMVLSLPFAGAQTSWGPPSTPGVSEAPPEPPRQPPSGSRARASGSRSPQDAVAQHAVAVANNQDGRLEAVWVQAGAVMHAWQVAPNSGWSAPIPLTVPVPSPLAGDPLIELNGAGRLEVVVDTDAGTFNAWQVAPNSGWSEWSLIGPGMHRPALSRIGGMQVCSMPTASVRTRTPEYEYPPPPYGCYPYEPLYLFYGTPEGGELHGQVQGWPGGPWNPPQVLIPDLVGDGPYFPVAFNVVADFIAPIVVFAGSGDSLVCEGSYWSSSGCVTTGSPSGGFKSGVAPQLGASVNLDGRGEIYGLGADGGLWHIYQLLDGTWSGWEPMFAPRDYTPGAPDLVGAPQAQRNLGGTLEVVMAAADGSLWHTFQHAPNSAWGGWYELGPTGFGGSTAVALARNQDGRLEAFAVSPSGQVTHTYQPAPSTGPWSPVIPL